MNAISKKLMFNNNIKYRLHLLYTTYYMSFSGAVSFILSVCNLKKLRLEMFFKYSFNIFCCFYTEDINLCD